MLHRFSSLTIEVKNKAKADYTVLHTQNRFILSYSSFLYHSALRYPETTCFAYENNGL